MDRRHFLTLVPAAVVALRRPSEIRIAESADRRIAKPCRPAEPPRRRVDRWSWAMGQPVHLRLFADSEDRGYEAAQAAFAELRRVEALLSRFDAASELNELHRLAGRRPLAAGADLLAVLAAAAAYRRLTHGAFDIAVEPLMHAWGFREPRYTSPSSAELAEARSALAAARIRIDAGRVFLPSAHTRLDLGGIGVGYGLDRAGAVLRSRGIRCALLEISGDILAIGAPPGTEGWPVDIATPTVSPDEARSSRLKGAPLLATAHLKDQALATSGQSAERRRFGPRSVGHVMDPAAGGPVSSRWQATVVASTALEADVLAKALLVNGRRTAAMHARWLVPSPSSIAGGT